MGTPNVISNPAPAISSPMMMKRRPIEAPEWEHAAADGGRSTELRVRSAQFQSAEEVAQLEHRRLGRVRAMRGIPTDRLAEIPAQRPWIRLGRIGWPHRVAPLLDGVGRFEREQHAGS